MNFRRSFAARPGAKVDLAAIDPGYSGKQDRERTEAKTRKAISRLRDLQYLLFANGERSLLIVLQGPDASGKDGLIRHLFSGLNPQGVNVADFKEPTIKEAAHDFLWRVHRHAPGKGRIMVFNRSHYEDALLGRVREHHSRAELKRRCGMINSFEDLLADNGTAIVKFYLHISPAEQLDRFRRRLKDPLKQWKISEADYQDRELWPRYIAAYEDTIEHTSTSVAPWYVIPSDHKWYRNFAISKIIVETLRDLHLKAPRPKVDLAKIRQKYHAAEKAD